MTPQKDLLIQRYIRDPHLIDGYKYDMRVYVAVTCVDPLRVYVYREGLVRLATERYSDADKNLKKRCMHLTNYSVNVKREGFTMGEGAAEDDVGFKWSLSALRRHFDEQGLDFCEVWARCKDVITKTMMCVESKLNTLMKMHVPDRRNCYEVFGFDIMLDTALQPWLIEVNTGPSLSAPSALDMHIKHRMLANLFNLVGFVPYDRARFEAEEGARRQARLTGVPTAPSKGKSASAAARKWGKAGAGASAAAALGQGRAKSAHSSGSSGSSGSGSGLGSSASAFPKKRDIKALEGARFDNVALADLPEIVQEAEAELARAGEFERCFPATSSADNEYYLRYFESARYNNVLLCKWEAFKHQLRRERRRAVAADDGGAADPGAAETSVGASRPGAPRPPGELGSVSASWVAQPHASLSESSRPGGGGGGGGGSRPLGGRRTVAAADVGSTLASSLARAATLGGVLGAAVHTRAGVGETPPGRDTSGQRRGSASSQPSSARGSSKRAPAFR